MFTLHAIHKCTTVFVESHNQKLLMMTLHVTLAKSLGKKPI